MTGARGSSWRLVFASSAVLLAAADTYVVVLALPSIMGDVGVSLDQLQRATPIVSGFLLGYVAMLPLLGRLSDIHGRQPVFIACLVAFAGGSLITAGADNLTTVVTGRTIQGLGGGGLVPVTVALVADLWPAGQRGTPLGVVAGVQEFGSVLGPLYGAAVVTVSSWRAIFWINVPLSCLMGVAFILVSNGDATLRAGTLAPAAGHAAAASEQPRPRRPHRFDGVGIALLTLGGVLAILAYIAPPAISSNLVLGRLYGPLAGDLGASSTISIGAALLLVCFVAWEVAQPFQVSPHVPLRRLPVLWRDADWLGALLAGAVLACVVLSFATADPSHQVLADGALYLVPAGTVLAVLFVLRERTATGPLIDFGAFGDRAAGGGLITNLVLGAALMAALVDIPIFARGTVFPNSQLQAALVLTRMLAAVPIGALAGGVICERLSYRVTAAIGMALSSSMFVAMTRWDAHTLSAGGVLRTPVRPSDVALALGGLGFGLAIAPINAAVLSATGEGLHGIASALVVAARMIGMLVGLSVLTAFGLRSFNEAALHTRSPFELCPHSPASCPRHDVLVTQALVQELHVIFAGAAICAGLAALLSMLLLRRTAPQRTLIGGRRPGGRTTEASHG